MFDRVISFIKNLPGTDGPRALTPEEDPRVAAAALMFHVVNADGVLQPAEQAKLRSTLAEHYSVSGNELESLIEAGEQAEQESIDLYAFTRILKQHLDADERLEFIELLWEMAYADGRADELEDNTVWRVAELIGVDGRDRIAAKQRVKASIAGATDGPGTDE